MTNHPSGPQVACEPAGARLMRCLDYRLSPASTEPLTPAQVAVVLHALADHTAITEAMRYRPEPPDPWQVARSLGRWFHDTADQLEERL